MTAPSSAVASRSITAADPIVVSAGFDHWSAESTAMGGRLGLHVATRALAPTIVGREGRTPDPAADMNRVIERVRTWAARLTRFDPASDLCALNAAPDERVLVRPTLGAALEWAGRAAALSEGFVDVGLLRERLDAETGRQMPDRQPASDGTAGRRWSVVRTGDRGRRLVTRPPGLGIDLDGVGKGWIADRALGLLDSYPGAVVDADGDLAIRVAEGDRWRIGVEDPRQAGFDLAVFELVGFDLAGQGGRTAARFGLATSGTSIHRWRAPDGDRHHLIDPRTGRPAITDLVQATVLAASAREAEVLAKTAAILGSIAGLNLLERQRVLGAVVLTEAGESLALPSTNRYLSGWR